jgi:hypothetical protein
MKIRLKTFNAFQNAPGPNTCFFLDDIEEIIEHPPPDPLPEAPSWRNPSELMPLTSITPPLDVNPTGGHISFRGN